MSQLVAPTIELCVGQVLVLINNGSCFGGSGNLDLKQCCDGLARWLIRGRWIPVGEQLQLLTFGQPGQLTQWSTWISRDRFQQGLDMP